MTCHVLSGYVKLLQAKSLRAGAEATVFYLTVAPPPEETPNPLRLAHL